MSIADAMASNGMKEAGYEYINMDGKISQDANELYLYQGSLYWGAGGKIPPQTLQLPPKKFIN